MPSSQQSTANPTADGQHRIALDRHKERVIAPFSAVASLTEAGEMSETACRSENTQFEFAWLPHSRNVFQNLRLPQVGEI